MKPCPETKFTLVIRNSHSAFFDSPSHAQDMWPSCCWSVKQRRMERAKVTEAVEISSASGGSYDRVRMVRADLACARRKCPQRADYQLPKPQALSWLQRLAANFLALPWSDRHPLPPQGVAHHHRDGGQQGNWRTRQR